MQKTHLMKDCYLKYTKNSWEFPGGPVVKTLCFHCWGRGFNTWSGNWDPTCCEAKIKIKNKIKLYKELLKLNRKTTDRKSVV